MLHIKMLKIIQKGKGWGNVALEYLKEYFFFKRGKIENLMVDNITAEVLYIK